MCKHLAKSIVYRRICVASEPWTLVGSSCFRVYPLIHWDQKEYFLRICIQWALNSAIQSETDMINFITSYTRHGLQFLQYCCRDKNQPNAPWGNRLVTGWLCWCKFIQLHSLAARPFGKCCREKIKPRLQNKASFRLPNIKVQNVDKFAVSWICHI